MGGCQALVLAVIIVNLFTGSWKMKGSSLAICDGILAKLVHFHYVHRSMFAQTADDSGAHPWMELCTETIAE